MLYSFKEYNIVPLSQVPVQITWQCNSCIKIPKGLGLDLVRVYSLLEGFTSVCLLACWFVSNGANRRWGLQISEPHHHVRQHLQISVVALLFTLVKFECLALKAVWTGLSFSLESSFTSCCHYEPFTTLKREGRWNGNDVIVVRNQIW